MPQQSTTAGLFSIRGTVYESLVGYDPSTGDHAVPMLAESWSRNDDSTVWTFNLRHGVQFQRGAGEFTSADVKFTWEILTRDSSLASDAAMLRSVVKSVDTPDPYTAIFNLNGPSNFANTQVLWNSSMLIMSKNYYDRVGEKTYAREPVGTGPYVLKKWNPGAGMQFANFEDYWGTAPDFAELDLRYVAEDQTRVSMLQAGEADVIDLPRVLVDSVKSAGMDVAESVFPSVTMQLWFGSMYLPDVGGHPWKDPRVREALNLGFDREAISKGPLRGYAEPVAFTMLGPDSPGYKQIDRDPFPYDPQRAKQLLAEAGYSDGLDIDVKVPEIAGISEVSTVIEGIAAQWNEIGVHVNIQKVDLAPIAKGYRARDDLPYIFVARSPYNLFDPKTTLNTLYSAAGAYGGTGDAEVEGLLKDASKTADDAELGEIYVKIARRIYDNFETIPLPAVTALVAYNPKTVDTWIGTNASGLDGLTTLKHAG